VAIFQRNPGSSHDCGVAIVCGTSATAALTFGDSDDDNRGGVLYAQGTDTMSFRVSAGTYATLTSAAFTVATDLLVDDDLTLLSDSAVLGFGADTDVTLTHVHDTALSLNKDFRIAADDEKLVLGAGQDASLFYDGTYMVAKPNDVGSGPLLVTAGSGTIPTLDNTTALVVQRNQSVGADCRLTILGGASGQTVLDFGDAADQNIGAVIYDHTNNYMDFRVDAGTKMRIDSSGDVGIGVTTMSYKLDVSGTVRVVGLPTSDPSVAGALWDSSGDLKISQG
jgi:hypothetical protein